MVSGCGKQSAILLRRRLSLVKRGGAAPALPICVPALVPKGKFAHERRRRLCGVSRVGNEEAATVMSLIASPHN